MRQKDVPRELLIGENVWTISFVRVIDGDENTLGLCDPSEFRILIKQGQSFAQRKSTVLHELLHALGFEYGFYEMPHSLVYKISEACSDFLIKNMIFGLDARESIY